MLLSQVVNTFNWNPEFILSEMEEGQCILEDLFGSLGDALVDPVFEQFVSDAGLALDWETVGDEIASLVVQCEDELIEAVNQAYGYPTMGSLDEESDTSQAVPDPSDDEEEEEDEEPAFVYGGGRPTLATPDF